MSRTKLLRLRNNVQLSVSKHWKWRQNHRCNCLDSIHISINYHSCVWQITWAVFECVYACALHRFFYVGVFTRLIRDSQWASIVTETNPWINVCHWFYIFRSFSLFFYLFIHVRLFECGGVNYVFERPIFLFLRSTF